MGQMSAAFSRKKQRGGEVSPAWSTDGKQFAYSYTDWDRFEFGLYLGDIWRRRCRTCYPYGNSPEWSPDGSEIAYSISHQFGARLTFMDVRTRKLEQPLPDKALRLAITIRLGQLRETDLPFLGTGIRCR